MINPLKSTEKRSSYLKELKYLQTSQIVLDKIIKRTSFDRKLV